MYRIATVFCLELALLLAGCGPDTTRTPTVIPSPTAPPPTTEPATANAEAPAPTTEPTTSNAELPAPTADPATATVEPPTATPDPAGPTPPPPMTGEVVFMSGPREEGGSSLMKRIWNWQLEQGNVPACPECVDAVALVDPHVGKKVWLQHPNGEIVGPLMVVDVAAEEHRANLRARGRLGDISWELAQKWGMTGPLDGVTLYFESPSEAVGENGDSGPAAP